MEPSNYDDATDLAADLSRVLGRELTPRDFRDRRDGARAPVLGYLATSSRQTCRTACRFLAEWTEQVDSDIRETLWGHHDLDIPTVVAAGHVLFAGSAVGELTATTPSGVVEQLLPTVATLAGAIPSVIALAPGEAPDPVPGWVSRLRVLVRMDELPARDAGELAWLVAAHEAAASVYVPDAAKDSLWTLVQVALTDTVVKALHTAGEYPGDPYRADRPEFADIINTGLSRIFHESEKDDGSVLHVMRLPRRDSRKTHRGVVLLAPKKIS
ncbi:hypothetical protein ACTD5D_21195 [Nocardia takedensis]|uniref:hypothetical protein n=1 Tax=Nocardia takedensis TaxID=259390 RepID=UPI003F759728